MDSQIVNPSNGRSGGLILFWKKEIRIEHIFLHQITLMFRLWNQQARYGDLLASMENQDGKTNTKPGTDREH
jgi:hypothetical protein